MALTGLVLKAANKAKIKKYIIIHLKDKNILAYPFHCWRLLLFGFEDANKEALSHLGDIIAECG
ncbi:TPA: hypothetical protein PP069_004406 [Serratia rubidaea]|nr:hypothetical protein [Serratia rubidaea]